MQNSRVRNLLILKIYISSFKNDWNAFKRNLTEISFAKEIKRKKLKFQTVN